MATCEFTLVPCPKECKDEDGVAKTFLRKDMKNHLKEDCPNRDYECVRCGEEGIYCYITGIHDSMTCLKKVVPCRNARCCKVMPRENLDSHNRKCEYAIVSCKYEDIGCEGMMERRNIATHDRNNDSFHLHLALDAVVELKGAVGDLEDSLKDAEDQLADLRCPSKTFALRRFEEKKEGNEVFTSPSFYTSHRGYKMQLKVYVNGRGSSKGTHMSAYARFSTKGHEIESPCGKVIVTLLNQLVDENHHTKTINIFTRSRMRSGSGRGVRRYAPHSILNIDIDKCIQYLKDDMMYFRVSFQEKSDKPWLNCN